MGGGFWGGYSEPYNLTDCSIRFTLIKDLGDGWGIYRKQRSPRSDCDRARLYFELEQEDNGPCQWLVSDIKVVDLTETGGAIVRFLSAVILNLAYAGRKEVAA